MWSVRITVSVVLYNDQQVFIWTGSLSIVAGLALLAAAYLSNDYEWVLLRESFPLRPGSGASGSFIAELDEPCEVEIEFDMASISAYPELRESVLDQAALSNLDIGWQVNSGPERVAGGASKEYLHIRGTNSNPVAQAIFHVLNIAGYKGEPGTLGRGVGRFPCQRGRSYSATVTAGDGQKRFDAVEAALVVRLNQAFGARRQRQSAPMLWGAGGLLAIGAVGVAGALAQRGRARAL